MSVDLTSAGALNALDFCASVISQGVSDFNRLWNPREENWNLSPQTRAKQPEQSHPATHKPLAKIMLAIHLSFGMVCYTALLHIS